MDIQSLHKIYLSCDAVTTDSRNCPSNSIFFALRGESFNGNLYAHDAISSGTKYAVVDDKTVATTNGNIILVQDVLKTLQELARYHRKWLSIPILAITGTNGKTTTKELTREVLKQKYSIKATEGNLNNHIGVPLTLLSFNKNEEIGIVEMGANHPDEIELLCNIADPDLGLITNIGKAHLEGFGSIEGVIKTKGELYKHLSQNAGTLFANKDNPLLTKIIPGNTENIFYGVKNKEGLIYGDTSGDSFFLSFTWHNNNSGNSYRVSTGMIGNYNLENALAAITVGTFFEVPEKLINKAISEYSPSNNRSQYLNTGKNEILLDAYNANPSSMQKALDNFKALTGDKKVLILGGMKELGKDTEKEHIELVKKILELNPEKIFLIGAEFKPHLDITPWAEYFNNVGELTEFLKSAPLKGYKILVKGSRSNKLERCVKYL